MCPHYKPAGLCTCVIPFPLSPVYLPVCDAQAGKRGGIRVKISGLWVAGQTLFVCACTHVSVIYPGCTAPTGLKQVGMLL